jgi:DNA mismatch repair protein MutS
MSRAPDALRSAVRGLGALVTTRAAWEFDTERAADALAQQFAVKSAEGFGLGAADAPALGAAGALLRYLRELQPGGLPHLARPTVERPGGTMPLDEMTRRNLELVESLRGGERRRARCSACSTARRRRWARAAAAAVAAGAAARRALPSRRGSMRWGARERRHWRAPRCATRSTACATSSASPARPPRRATPRELRALGDSLARLPARDAAARADAWRHCWATLAESWDDAADSRRRFAGVGDHATLVERPPLAIGEGETIAAGWTANSTSCARSRRRQGRHCALQAEERARTGSARSRSATTACSATSSRSRTRNAHSVPADYQRRQTLTGAERYVTPALKEFEEKVLTATERIERWSASSSRRCVRRRGRRLRGCRLSRRAWRSSTCWPSLAEVAAREGMCARVTDDEAALEIVGGRHPVVER